MLERFEFSLIDNQVSVTNQRTTNHRLGQSLVSPDNDFCYINIPKNASSTLATMFLDWRMADFRQLDSNTKFIVVLRDPTERWVSAIAEFLVGQNGLGSITHLTEQDLIQVLKSDLIKNWIFSSVYFDAHSLPQCYFLQGLHLDNAKFFFQDKNLTNKLAEFVNAPTVDNLNVSSQNSFKLLVIDYLTDLISKDTTLAKTIDIHYWCDHQLFDKVRFEE